MYCISYITVNLIFTATMNVYEPDTLSTVSWNILRSPNSEHFNTVPLKDVWTLLTTAVEFTAVTVPPVCVIPSKLNKKIPNIVGDCNGLLKTWFAVVPLVSHSKLPSVVWQLNSAVLPGQNWSPTKALPAIFRVTAWEHTITRWTSLQCRQLLLHHCMAYVAI